MQCNKHKQPNCIGNDKKNNKCKKESTTIERCKRKTENDEKISTCILTVNKLTCNKYKSGSYLFFFFLEKKIRWKVQKFTLNMSWIFMFECLQQKICFRKLCTFHTNLTEGCTVVKLVWKLKHPLLQYIAELFHLYCFHKKLHSKDSAGNYIGNNATGTPFMILRQDT